MLRETLFWVPRASENIDFSSLLFGKGETKSWCKALIVGRAIHEHEGCGTWGITCFCLTMAKPFSWDRNFSSFHIYALPPCKFFQFYLQFISMYILEIYVCFHSYVLSYTSFKSVSISLYRRSHIWGVSRQLSQCAAREPQIVLFLTHVYDTKKYLKNCLISVSDVFFSQLSNDVSSFSKIFRFHLQKVQNMLYLKKCIFNIFFTL